MSVFARSRLCNRNDSDPRGLFPINSVRPSRRLWDGTRCAGTEVGPQKIIQDRSRNRLTELYYAVESSSGRYRVFFESHQRIFRAPNLWISADKICTYRIKWALSNPHYNWAIALKFMLIRLIRINYTFIAVIINYFQKIIRLSLKCPGFICARWLMSLSSKL